MSAQKYRLFFTHWVEPRSWRLLLEQCDRLWVLAGKPKINPNWSAIEYDSFEKEGIEGGQGYSIKAPSSFFRTEKHSFVKKKQSLDKVQMSFSFWKSMQVKTDYHQIDINRAEFRELKAGRIISWKTNGVKYHS